MKFIKYIKFPDNAPFQELPIKICGSEGNTYGNGYQRIYAIDIGGNLQYSNEILLLEPEVGDNLYEHLNRLGKWLLELSSQEKERVETIEYNKRIKESELLINNLSFERMEEIFKEKYRRHSQGLGNSKITKEK